MRVAQWAIVALVGLVAFVAEFKFTNFASAHVTASQPEASDAGFVKGVDIGYLSIDKHSGRSTLKERNILGGYFSWCECGVIGFHAGKIDRNSPFFVIRSSAVRSAASKPLQAMTALAISMHDRGCSAPLSDPRMSRGNSCRPSQSQPLRLGLRGRISSGSASGHMMRTAASRCTRSARSWSRAASRAIDLTGQLGALAG